MILGIDVSTSITGITILDKDGEILECSHIDLRKEKNFFKKAELVETALIRATELIDIEEVYIEQPFTFFSSGQSLA